MIPGYIEDENAWRLLNGTIKCSTPSSLWYTAAKLSDLKLTLEFRCDAHDASADLLLRFGDLYRVPSILQQKGLRIPLVTSSTVGAGEWHALEIYAIGDRVTALIDGKPIPLKPQRAPEMGFVGIQHHGGRMSYRNIRLRPLKPEQPVTPGEAILFRPTAVVLAKFPDVECEPFSKGALQRMFLGPYPSIDHYVQRSTSGRVSLRGTQVVGWVTLPKSRQYYQSRPYPNETVAQDALQVADPSLDLRQFDLLTIYTNAVVAGVSSAGGIHAAPDGVDREWVWCVIEPLEGMDRLFGLTAHELGHALGLSHSSTVQGAPSWWTGMGMVMSGGVPRTYSGFDRFALNGIPPKQIVTVTGSEARIVELSNVNDSGSAGHRLIQVPAEVGHAYYTIELRQPDNLYDRAPMLPDAGVIIHEVVPGRGGVSIDPFSNSAGGCNSLVIPPPGYSAAEAEKRAWHAGQEFADPRSGVRVKVLEATDNRCRVSVQGSSGQPIGVNLLPRVDAFYAWRFGLNRGAEARLNIRDGIAEAEIIRPGDADLSQWVAGLEEGATYRLRFALRADRERPFRVFAVFPGGYGRLGLGKEELMAGLEWRTYEFEFVARDQSIYMVRVPSFDLGATVGRVWIRDTYLAKVAPPKDPSPVLRDLPITNHTTGLTVELWQNAAPPPGGMLKEQLHTFDLRPEIETNRIRALTPYVDEKVYFECGDATRDGRVAYALDAPLYGVWHHFAFVADRSARLLKIYQNGQIKATREGAGFILPGTYTLHVGGERLHFAGEIREFRVWNGVRSDGQIREAMNRAVGERANGLIGYYAGTGPVPPKA